MSCVKMVVIVYSAASDKTILSQIGLPDYSYYFVLKKFRTVLCDLATVIDVEKPDLEVDAIYEKCLQRGESCLFFSFTPPFKSAVGLRCPTIAVFAWEFATIPNMIWNSDPRNDWRYVFRQHGCAITHSNFAVQTVKKAMGNDFPVWSIPAPVWDDYVKFYSQEKTPIQSEGIDLTVDGTFIDFKGCDAPFVPEDQKVPYIQERTFSKNRPASGETLHLSGVIYTSVFNPGDGRKNWPDMIKGYIWAFRDLEETTLILKVVHHDFADARKQLTDELFKLMPFKCRVVILYGYLRDDAYAKLVRATTYIVNTAHGEGQCLPLMEFMSAGKPAIAPAHTAMEDYIGKDNAFIVQSSLERAYWPDDPSRALRTFRYRINWESLYHAYLDSYQVAKNNPLLYENMSACAVESLKKYCSKAVVKERLERVFSERGMNQENGLFSLKMKVWHTALKMMRDMKDLQNRTGKTAATCLLKSKSPAQKIVLILRKIRMKVWDV